MGLTNDSVGTRAADRGLVITKQSDDDRVIALAGNPNVGKSTVFNSLTGLNQHTGNWPGKTVTNAQGRCSTKKRSYVMVDIPGTYSLMAHSAEEEVARDFICFGNPDAVVVVCDATCLERNLNLVLQTMEICGSVIVCVNLMDEAKRKNIRIDLPGFSKRLGVPVVGTVARKGETLDGLKNAMDAMAERGPEKARFTVSYAPAVEAAAAIVGEAASRLTDGRLDSRFLSLRLLEGDESFMAGLDAYFGGDFLRDGELHNALKRARALLEAEGITENGLKDSIVSSIVKAAEDICAHTVKSEKNKYDGADRRMDKLLTSRRTGYPIMMALLALVFYLTITGANYPSQLISDALFRVQDWLSALMLHIGAPDWLHGALVLGVYRVLAWVVSVMLPPMAIFFPLFTLLEDAGYLPRVAYNLDRPFKRCSACGKQALTMWVVDERMRWICNAALRFRESRRCLWRETCLLSNHTFQGFFPGICPIAPSFSSPVRAHCDY